MVRVDVIEELKFLGKFTKNILFFFEGGGGGGGRVGGGGGPGACERRIEFFVKIQKNGGLGLGGLRRGGRGVRVDVNEELKFWGKFTKKKSEGGGRLGGEAVRWGGGLVGGGSHCGCERNVGGRG